MRDDFWASTSNQQPNVVQHIKTILAINGKVSLDILWLRDKTLEDSASLPAPDVLATEIVQDHQAALAQFATIAEDLGGDLGQVLAD